MLPFFRIWEFRNVVLIAGMLSWSPEYVISGMLSFTLEYIIPEYYLPTKSGRSQNVVLIPGIYHFRNTPEYIILIVLISGLCYFRILIMCFGVFFYNSPDLGNMIGFFILLVFLFSYFGRWEVLGLMCFWAAGSLVQVRLRTRNSYVGYN